MPIPKEAIYNILKKIAERVEKGRIPAYHGTTREAAEKIAQEGFKGVRFPKVIRETYSEFGIPWEERKKVPRMIRDYVESDARGRILSQEEGVISFAPTRNVAERWAGKGGEVKSEIWKRLSDWFTAKGKGMTPEEFLNAPFDIHNPYRELGDPVVIKTEIPLSSGHQKSLLRELEYLMKEVGEPPHKPETILKSFLEHYRDVRLPEEELEGLKIIKVLPKRSRKIK